jgi:hypothetical protein
MKQVKICRTFLTVVNHWVPLKYICFILQHLGELLAQAVAIRPPNSPPTYDDAMKFVNEAFEIDEDETEDALPPEYSETLGSGEEVNV